MKKTPVDTNADGKIDQAEDIIPFLTKNFFHFLKEMEEQKLAEWVSEEETNKQLFNELTDQKEIQKNLAEEQPLGWGSIIVLASSRLLSD